MILKSPGDVFFTVFNFPVYYYGVILALSCLVAVYIAKIVYEKVYQDARADLIWEVSPFVLILGILGARLYYCLVNYTYYFQNPFEIFYIRGGGLSIHGGIIAGILGLWLAAKKYKMSFLRLLDVFSVGTVFAQGLGRWGNFFNNEAFGSPHDGLVKLFVPLSQRPSGYENVEYFHPAFLYESIADFLIFLILLFVIKKFGVKFEGLTLCIYLMLYSLARFFVEDLRLDSAMNVGGIHIAQIISAVIFVFAFLMFLVLFFKKRRDLIN